MQQYSRSTHPKTPVSNNQRTISQSHSSNHSLLHPSMNSNSADLYRHQAAYARHNSNSATAVAIQVSTREASYWTLASAISRAPRNACSCISDAAWLAALIRVRRIRREMRWATSEGRERTEGGGAGREVLHGEVGGGGLLGLAFSQFPRHYVRDGDTRKRAKVCFAL